MSTTRLNEGQNNPESGERVNTHAGTLSWTSMLVQKVASRFVISDISSPEQTIQGIEQDIEFKGFNLWILVLSIFICSIGLNVDSTAVVIGAMLISPLMGPIMGVGLGIGIQAPGIIRNALSNLLVAVGISILTSALYFTISPIEEASKELFARTTPTLLDVGVALFGGLAGILAGSRKEKSNVVPGVAIATALMPPLCTAGSGLANGQWQFLLGGFYLFVINAMLIASATMLVVRLLRFPIVQNVDAATERKYKRRFSVMLFALLVPSVYILYTTVSTSLLSSTFHNFVEDNIEAPGMLVVEEVVDLTGAHPRIDVVVVGKQVSEGTIAKWQRQIETISPNAKLSVFQNDVDNTGVEELRRMIDLYAQGQASLERKDGELDKLREEAVQLETKLSLALQRQFPESLPGELLSAFPEMGKLRLGFLGKAAQQEHAISFSETPFFEVTWVDTTHVEQREEKLSAFLKARLGRTDIEVVSNLGGSSVDPENLAP